MDSFEEYSLLPPELQYRILRDNDEVRTARSLSAPLRTAALYDAIEKDLLRPLTPEEIKQYLETLPVAFRVFYQRREGRDLFGNLVSYEYTNKGYMASRYIICALRNDISHRFSLVDDYEVKIDEIAQYANPKTTPWDILIPDYIPILPIDATKVFYDLPTYKSIILERLKILGLINVQQIQEVSTKAVMRYFDDIVNNSQSSALMFVYYFVVSSAHLLAIPVTDETKEYFQDTDFEYDAWETEDPKILRMEASIERIAPLIRRRLECL